MMSPQRLSSPARTPVPVTPRYRLIAPTKRNTGVISSYLPEILAVSDRILVARQGRIVSEFDPASTTEEELLDAAVH
jgi:ABC-type sugar transport system ATPase subunit